MSDKINIAFGRVFQRLGGKSEDGLSWMWNVISGLTRSTKAMWRTGKEMYHCSLLNERQRCLV